MGSRPTRPFLTARWHALLMLSYEIDPDRLRPLVPAGTELDTWQGRCFVSMVGFRFLDTRVRGVAIPWHRDFDEVNLRFYVRRRVADEVRRGVVFVREIVPRRAIAWVARTLYGERYVRMPMAHEVALPSPDGSGTGVARYRWRFRGRWCELAAQCSGAPQPAAPESEERFITEHYWGYARQRDGSTVEYRVHHPSWKVWRAVEPHLDCDVRGLYGEPFADALSQPPSSALVADGSEVAVDPGHRLSSS